MALQRDEQDAAPIEDQEQDEVEAREPAAVEREEGGRKRHHHLRGQERVQTGPQRVGISGSRMLVVTSQLVVL